MHTVQCTLHEQKDQNYYFICNRTQTLSLSVFIFYHGEIQVVHTKSLVLLPNNHPPVPLSFVVMRVHGSYVWRLSFHCNKFLRIFTTLSLLSYCTYIQSHVSSSWLTSLHGPRVKQMLLLILFLCFHLSAFCNTIRKNGMLFAYH